MDTKAVLALILGCWVVCCNGAAFAQKLDMDEFGVTEGLAIRSGVVFIDGAYVPSPYTVSRKGLSLYVNDRQIKRPRRHMQTPILTTDSPTSQLPSQERQRLYRALEATRGICEKYLGRGYGYLFSSRGGHVKLSPYTVAYQLSAVMDLLEAEVPRDEKLGGLRDYNWHLHIDIEPLVDNFSPSTRLSSAVTQQAEELLRVDEFGMGQPVSVTEGFVILKGRYVEAPYFLQRKGLGVFLNGQMIVPPQKWPREVARGSADVALPGGISAESSWFDESVRRYVADKFAYLSAHNDIEQAAAMKAQVIAALPFVTQAERDKERSHVLNVSTTEGLTIPCLLVSVQRGGRLDRDGLRQSLDRTVEHHAKLLSTGACFVLTQGGGGTFLPSKNVGRRLQRLVETLGSDAPSGTKRAEIKKISDAISDKAISEMIKRFSESAQLRARIEELSQSERADRNRGPVR